MYDYITGSLISN